MGKNFSRNQKRENRNEADNYPTPHGLIQSFIEHAFYYDDLFCLEEESNATGKRSVIIADFCCGNKNIGEVLRNIKVPCPCTNYHGLEEYNIHFVETDLKSGVDFFSLTVNDIENLCIGTFPDIGIMHPSLNLFSEWVKRCCYVFKLGFALLAPTSYLQKIPEIFSCKQEGSYYDLMHILTFNHCPLISSCLRKDGKIKKGKESYSWFVFLNKTLDSFFQLKISDNALRWICIDEYILKKDK